MEGRAAVMEVVVVVVARHHTAQGFLGREDHLMLREGERERSDHIFKYCQRVLANNNKFKAME
jgi:hypothetical protein